MDAIFCENTMRIVSTQSRYVYLKFTTPMRVKKISMNKIKYTLQPYHKHIAVICTHKS